MDIQELKSNLSDLENRLQDIKENVLLVDSKIARLNQIESDLSKEEVWSDLELSQKLSKEKTSIDKAITSFNEVSNKLSDSMVLLDVSIEENDDSSIEEIFSEAKEITSTIEALEFSRMFTNKMDSSSAYIEIQSGSGGTEAQDWAEMILRMYTKWSESRQRSKSTAICRGASKQHLHDMCTINVCRIHQNLRGTGIGKHTATALCASIRRAAIFWGIRSTLPDTCHLRLEQARRDNRCNATEGGALLRCTSTQYFDLVAKLQGDLCEPHA